jgi:hypothetical protein
MKRTNLLLIALMLTSVSLFAQESSEEFVPSGKAFGKVFFNYHYDATENATQKNTFEVQRAYIGYKYKFSPNISMKLTLDAARQVKDDGGNLLTPYSAQLKHAQLDWKVADPVKLSIGLIGLKQFDTQEKFWGYRYLFKSFQDEFKLGSSADLGINAEFKLAKSLKANLFLLNGEGYSRLQDNNGRMKAGGNLLWAPIDGLIIKGYYDIYGGDVVNDSGLVVTDTASIYTVNFFAGYKTDKFRIGGGYNYQLNGSSFYRIAEDHIMSGFSFNATYVINKKWEVFGYYLGFDSEVPTGEVNKNESKNGDIIIGGFQYAPVKGVKVAFNYRNKVFDKEGKPDQSLIYVNFEYAF